MQTIPKKAQQRMPKLYEYFGLVVFFFANEHEPIHVHGRYQNAEMKAEIIEDQVNKIKIVYESTETPKIFEIIRAES